MLTCVKGNITFGIHLANRIIKVSYARTGLSTAAIG